MHTHIHAYKQFRPLTSPIPIDLSVLKWKLLVKQFCFLNEISQNSTTLTLFSDLIMNINVGRYRRYRAALSRDSYRAIRKLSPLIYSQSWVRISTKEGKLGWSDVLFFPEIRLRCSFYVHLLTFNYSLGDTVVFILSNLSVLNYLL